MNNYNTNTNTSELIANPICLLSAVFTVQNLEGLSRSIN